MNNTLKKRLISVQTLGSTTLSIVYLLASVGCKKEPAKAPAQATKAVAPAKPVPPTGKTAQVLTLEHLDGTGTAIPGLDAAMSKGDESIGSLKGFAKGAVITAKSSDPTKATVAIDPTTGEITVSAVDNDNADVDVVLTFSSSEFDNFAAADINQTVTILAKVTPPTPPAADESKFTVNYSANAMAPLLKMTSTGLIANTEKVIVVVYEPVKPSQKISKDEIKFWGTIGQSKFVQDTELSLGDYIVDNTTSDARKLNSNKTYSIAVYSVDHTAATLTSKASAANFIEANKNAGALGIGVLQKQIINYTK